MERPPDVYSESFTACKEFVRVVPAPVTISQAQKQVCHQTTLKRAEEC